MRSLMSYYFTEMYGAEQKQYLDANNYNNTKRNHSTIVKLIATLKRATTTTDYTYINYYRKTYGEIPLWVLANVLTFGNLSKMFRVFPQSLKSKVSKNFEPLNHFLEIREEPPEYETKTGRKKKRNSVIGVLHGNKNTLTGS